MRERDEKILIDSFPLIAKEEKKQHVRLGFTEKGEENNANMPYVDVKYERETESNTDTYTEITHTFIYVGKRKHCLY